MDYDAIRLQQKRGLAQQIANLRSYVEKMQKAQRAAEKTMDMCVELVSQRQAFGMSAQVSEALLSLIVLRMRIGRAVTDSTQSLRLRRMVFNIPCLLLLLSLFLPRAVLEMRGAVSTWRCR